MPPRAQKRKLDDSPYAGLKRSNLASASNGLYPREPRERDRDGGYGSTAAGMTGREREYYDKYSGLSSYEREAIGPAQGNKRRKVEAAAPGPSSGYYATGGNALPREEGPLIAVRSLYLCLQYIDMSVDGPVDIAAFRYPQISPDL
jgi:hypothetical protein